MSLFKKKKNANNVCFNEVFGKLTYNYCWWADTPIVVKIFGKEFQMNLRICTDNKYDPVNQSQEYSCIDLRSQITEIENSVEYLLEKDFPFPEDTKRADLFVGGIISFSTKGKCGMMLDISENYYEIINLEEIGMYSGNSICICLLPDTFIIRTTDVFEELFG